MASIGEQILDELLELGAEPMASLDGQVRFRAPRGAISDELRIRMKAQREAIREAIIVRFDATLPPLPGHDEPPAADPQEVAERLAPLRAAFPKGHLEPSTELVDLHRWQPTGSITGKVVSAGDLLLVEGDLVSTGPVLTLGSARTNWVIVTGDLHCSDLAVVEDSNLRVLGDLKVQGAVVCATRDSSSVVAGAVTAQTVISGLGAGALTIGGELHVAVQGTVFDFSGNPIEAQGPTAELDPQLCRDNGRPDVDALIDRIAMCQSVFEP